MSLEAEDGEMSERDMSASVRCVLTLEIAPGLNETERPLTVVQGFPIDVDLV